MVLGIGGCEAECRVLRSETKLNQAKRSVLRSETKLNQAKRSVLRSETKLNSNGANQCERGGSCMLQEPHDEYQHQLAGIGF